MDALPLPSGSSDGLTLTTNALTQVADRVSRTHLHQVGGNAPYISESWQGAAARSRTEEADELRHRISSAAGRLPAIGAALRTYREVLDSTTENIRDWQRQWDEAEDTYRAHVRRLNGQPLPDEDRQAIADRHADERDTTHRRLYERHALAMQDLRDAGRTAATTIRNQCDRVVPPASAGDRLEIGAHLLQDLPLSGGQAMSELANALAPDFVELVDSALAGEDAALATLVERYGRYGADPYFAHAVMDRLGVQGMVELFHRLGELNLLDRGYEDLTGVQQDAAALLGSLYVAASGPAHGDIPDDGYNRHLVQAWRREWFADLMDAGNSSLRFHGQEYPGYWAQAQLLAAADAAGVVPGAAYMGSVGVDMVEWDRLQGRNDGARGWDFAAPAGDRPNLVHDDGSAFAGLARDPLYALLHAASQDEDAAHALLLGRVDFDGTEPVPGNDAGQQSVVHYLLRERGGTVAYAQPFEDSGRLLAQTVAEHGVDRLDGTSTELAAHYLHSYVRAVHDGEFANGRLLSPDALTQTRTATADIMVAHLDDLVRATQEPDLIEAPDDGGPTPVHMSTGDHGWAVLLDDDKLLSSTYGFLALDRPGDMAFAAVVDDGRGGTTTRVVGDPDNLPALQRIINAGVAHTTLSLDEAYAGGRSPSTPMTDGANFLVRVTESAGHTLLAEAEEADAYGQYVARLAASGAGMLSLTSVPVVGAPLSAGVGMASDAVLGHVVDTDHAVDQRQSTAVVRDDVRTLLEQQSTMAIIRAGAWEEGKDPVTWAANNSLEDDESFVRDGRLVPLDELMNEVPDEDHSRKHMAFFNRYLRTPDGATDVLTEMRNLLDASMAGARFEAEDHHDQRD